VAKKNGGKVVMTVKAMAVYLWPEEEVAPAEHVVAITIEVHHVAE
jgi:hypothetical protein